MAASENHQLQEIHRQLDEIQRLLRFLAHRQVRQLIVDNLTKPIERRVYELSDGLRSSRDIEGHVDKAVTQRTVVSWWQKWRKLGIVEQSPTYSGRMRQLISLDELGLDLDGSLER